MNIRWLVITGLAVLATPCMAQKKTEGVRFGQRDRTGALAAEQINESSGLARSLVHPGRYWTHNDNGLHAGLFLIDLNGRHLATLQLPGAEFRDWESLSSLSVDGQPYLVLADVGDNLSRYATGRLFVFREPTFDLPIQAEAADAANRVPVFVEVRDYATIEFTYPDGACDCEAVTVDASGKQFFMVSKRLHSSQTSQPTRLHWIPFRTESTTTPLVANRLPSEFQEPMVTGMDIAPNNELAVIRTYATAWIYRRRGRSWQEAFADKPDARTLLPLQRQGEAVCFTHDASGFIVTSEGLRQSIWRIGISDPADDR